MLCDSLKKIVLMFFLCITFGVFMRNQKLDQDIFSGPVKR